MRVLELLRTLRKGTKAGWSQSSRSGDAPSCHLSRAIAIAIMLVLALGIWSQLLSGCSETSSTTSPHPSGSGVPAGPGGGKASSPGLATKIGQIVFDGDSLTFGSGATDPYPNQVMRRLPREIKWENLSKGGRPIRVMLKRAPTHVDPLYNPSLGRNIVVLWGGSNDIALYHHTAEAVYQDIRSYCLGRRHVGFTVLVLTILPRSDRFSVGFEPTRQTLNEMLRRTWRQLCDGLVDVAADPRIGAAGASRDLRYYNFSFVHLNNLGLSIVAEHVLESLTPFENKMEL